MMSPEERINAFKQLGKYLASGDEQLKEAVQKAAYHNSWFTLESINSAIASWAHALDEAKLGQWIGLYQFKPQLFPKRIGLILAGNIPMVGFHDILCVLASGNSAAIKLSSQDTILIPFILSKLVEVAPEFSRHISYPERMKEIDAVIATGSNNSARYFEFYFGKHPHIIRKNRNSIAILKGNETKEQLRNVGKDIFSYFGMGCRNVSKLYFPKGYDITAFIDELEGFAGIVSQHHKYINNYDYYKSIYLVNKTPHLDNGFLLLKEDKTLASPLSVVYYEYYSDIHQLQGELAAQQDHIQCIAYEGAASFSNQTVPYGMTQYPELWDYADGIDTMKFLLEL